MKNGIFKSGDRVLRTKDFESQPFYGQPPDRVYTIAEVSVGGYWFSLEGHPAHGFGFDASKFELAPPLKTAEELRIDELLVSNNTYQEEARAARRELVSVKRTAIGIGKQRDILVGAIKKAVEVLVTVVKELGVEVLIDTRGKSAKVPEEVTECL